MGRRLTAGRGTGERDFDSGHGGGEGGLLEPGPSRTGPSGRAPVFADGHRATSRCLRSGCCGKNDFWGEVGTPFAGGGAMFVRAADEFVPAAPGGGPFQPDEAGGAEPRDRGGRKDEVGKDALVCFFNFHARSMTGEVGQMLSEWKFKNENIFGQAAAGKVQGMFCGSRLPGFQ